MKKVLLAITLMLGMTGFGQEEYARYSKGSILVVTKEGKTQKNMYMDVSDKVGLRLNPKMMVSFVEFVEECHTKHHEWDSIAKANSILDMSLKYYGDFKVKAYFDYGGWNFGLTNIQLVFSLKDGVSTSHLYISKVTSSTNEYIKSESVLLELTDELLEEYQTLLTIEAIDAYIETKTKNKNLFE
jgi:hypothetical protein